MEQMANKREGWTIEMFSDPDEADRRDRAYYQSLTPQQRVDMLLEICRVWGKTDQRPFERTIEVIQIPSD